MRSRHLCLELKFRFGKQNDSFLLIVLLIKVSPSFDDMHRGINERSCLLLKTLQEWFWNFNLRRRITPLPPSTAARMAAATLNFATRACVCLHSAAAGAHATFGQTPQSATPSAGGRAACWAGCATDAPGPTDSSRSDPSSNTFPG